MIKFVSVSVVIFIFLYIVASIIINTLDDLEQYEMKRGTYYPTRVKVVYMLLAISFIEMFISVICWIITM